MEHNDTQLRCDWGSLGSHTIEQNSTFQEVLAGPTTAQDLGSALISATAPQTPN